MRGRSTVLLLWCESASDDRKYLKAHAVGSVRLSILLPTNRSGLAAIASVAQACAWAGPEIQVVVRDNSGNAEKRALLKHFEREHCEIISVDPCEPLENYSGILSRAKGEFIFSISDDDQCFTRAINALPDLIGQISHDAGVVAVTGIYALELPQGSASVDYQDVDSDNPAVRVAGYLNYPGPNVLSYSVLRREVAERILPFMKSLPFYLSFHDQILCLLYLLNGRYVKLQRLFYVYDIGVWDTDESAQRRDIDFYGAAGLDPAINKLQWLLCGFEGAVLTMNSNIFPNYPVAQRQPIADLWFSTMYARFMRNPRMTAGSALTEEAEKLCAKLREASGQLTFQKLLADICGFMALFSTSQAQKYFDFWAAVLNKRQPLVGSPGAEPAKPPAA